MHSASSLESGDGSQKAKKHQRCVLQSTHLRTTMFNVSILFPQARAGSTPSFEFKSSHDIIFKRGLHSGEGSASYLDRLNLTNITFNAISSLSIPLSLPIDHEPLPERGNITRTQDRESIAKGLRQRFSDQRMFDSTK
jgi:hypothetical protein